MFYAVAAAQGALLALALSRRRINAGSNRVLAVWVSLVALDLAVRAVYLGNPAAETITKENVNLQTFRAPATFACKARL